MYTVHLLNNLTESFTLDNVGMGYYGEDEWDRYVYCNDFRHNRS